MAHICLSLEAAEAELPAVCAGELGAAASSGLGSNAALPEAERRVPRAIVFGAGVPDEEVARVTDAVRARAPGVAPVRVTRQDVLDTGAQAPNPEIIVKSTSWCNPLCVSVWRGGLGKLTTSGYAVLREKLAAI